MSDLKLWLLSPCDPEREPWIPWYDKTFGFVVRAENEQAAREFAANAAGDEEAAAWIDAGLSKCVELYADGEPGIILSDFASA